MADRFRARLVAAVLAAALVPAKAQAQTVEVFAAANHSTVQVRILENTSRGKASIGSGFVVGQPGIVVTNFHVVADLALKPGEYQAVYRTHDGNEGSLELLGVDVVHDIAVLRAKTLESSPLALSPVRPRNGERLYALGNPFDLGLTIVEGTYNGEAAESLYERLHFTGSINPGMSGGPALNAAGQVVGVNVATAGNQVSFLVPASRIHALLDHVETSSDRDFIEQVRAGLARNQELLAERLLARPFTTVRLKEFSAPGQLTDFMTCWGDTENQEAQPYKKTIHSCRTRDDVYLSGSQRTGSVRFQHELLERGKLGPVRFFGQLEKHFHESHLDYDADESDVTDYFCTSSFVANASLDSKVVFCARAYRKLLGLYDVQVVANSLNGSDRVLYTNLLLSGFSFENAVAVARTYLEAVTWPN